MRIGVPKEIKSNEYRVGLTPESVRELAGLGHEVGVESEAEETFLVAPVVDFVVDVQEGHHALWIGRVLEDHNESRLKDEEQAIDDTIGVSQVHHVVERDVREYLLNPHPL